MTKYCMDCGYYIAGGREKNCSYPWPRKQFSDASVCALREACGNFIEKGEAEDFSAYRKIDLRPKRKRTHKYGHKR